jgi:hypothetical protein
LPSQNVLDDHNRVLVAAYLSGVTLKWADPLGASANDYDLFVLDSTLANVVDLSDNVQNGAGDPLEETARPRTGEQVLVTLYSGAHVALHLASNGNTAFGPGLTINTNGAVYGHNATISGSSVAAINVAGAHVRRREWPV